MSSAQRDAPSSREMAAGTVRRDTGTFSETRCCQSIVSGCQSVGSPDAAPRPHLRRASHVGAVDQVNTAYQRGYFVDASHSSSASATRKYLRARPNNRRGRSPLSMIFLWRRNASVVLLKVVAKPRPAGVVSARRGVRAREPPRRDRELVVDAVPRLGRHDDAVERHRQRRWRVPARARRRLSAAAAAAASSSSRGTVVSSRRTARRRRQGRGASVPLRPSVPARVEAAADRERVRRVPVPLPRFDERPGRAELAEPVPEPTARYHKFRAKASRRDATFSAPRENMARAMRAARGGSS